MPPQGSHGLKTTGFPKSAPKSKKRKSEGTTSEVIDIRKPGSDENIELGDPVLVFELKKINPLCRLKDIPLLDTLGLTVLDGETRAAAEVFETLQKQQPGAGYHRGLNQSTPPAKKSISKVGG